MWISVLLWSKPFGSSLSFGLGPSRTTSWLRTSKIRGQKEWDWKKAKELQVGGGMCYGDFDSRGWSQEHQAWVAEKETVNIEDKADIAVWQANHPGVGRVDEDGVGEGGWSSYLDWDLIWQSKVQYLETSEIQQPYGMVGTDVSQELNMLEMTMVVPEVVGIINDLEMEVPEVIGTKIGDWFYWRSTVQYLENQLIPATWGHGWNLEGL
jgi:hypothetical protein